jgi:hypothetical protein
MRPLDDAPGPDELLPDLLAGQRDRTGRAEVTDALNAIDGALTDNIRPLTGAAAMSAPKRIQRKRTKGWKMPDGAVYVGRPTRWGNSWREGDTGWTVGPGGRINREPHPPLTREQAIESFRHAETYYAKDAGPDYFDDIRGRDLACWCPIDKPCHADVLLELANAEESA